VGARRAYFGEFAVVEELQQRALAHRAVADQYQTELIVEHQVGGGHRPVDSWARNATSIFEKYQTRAHTHTHTPSASPFT